MYVSRSGLIQLFAAEGRYLYNEDCSSVYMTQIMIPVNQRGKKYPLRTLIKPLSMLGLPNVHIKKR